MSEQRLTIGSRRSDGEPSQSQYDSTLEKVEGPALGSDTPAEFGAFASLSRKLVNVPKTEIDEQRKTSG